MRALGVPCGPPGFTWHLRDGWGLRGEGRTVERRRAGLAFRTGTEGARDVPATRRFPALRFALGQVTSLGREVRV